MKAVTKMLAGGLGVLALTGAAPAAAQYYPQPGYGGYGAQGVIGTILDTILGGRSYAQNDRYAVEQCVRAVEYRINTRGFDNEGGRYRNYAYGYGYNNQYRNYQGARVLSVTSVDRRSNGNLRIRGLATSGMPAAYGYGGPGYDPYGGYGAYGAYNQQAADARFTCNIDRYGRIRDIDARRTAAYPYRGY